MTPDIHRFVNVNLMPDGPNLNEHYFYIFNAQKLMQITNPMCAHSTSKHTVLDLPFPLFTTNEWLGLKTTAKSESITLNLRK